MSLFRDEGSNAGSGCCISPDWLEQNRLRVKTDFFELLFDKKALAVVGENGQAAKGWTLEPAAGLLEECLRSSNFMKLLGEGFAR